MGSLSSGFSGMVLLSGNGDGRSGFDFLRWSILLIWAMKVFGLTH
jgi:hypothetical protein